MPVEIAGKAIERAPSSSATCERAAVARREQLGLAGVAAAPDGTDRVHDPRRREREPGRRLRVAGRASPERGARVGERGSGRGEDRAAHAATAREPLVGGVHDRVDVLASDVTDGGDDVHRPHAARDPTPGFRRFSAREIPPKLVRKPQKTPCAYQSHRSE